MTERGGPDTQGARRADKASHDYRARRPVPARNTALFAQHQSLGASFTAFAGWNMPVRYTSDTDEHRAVRTTAGLFDLSHMGQIELLGPGRR